MFYLEIINAAKPAPILLPLASRPPLRYLWRRSGDLPSVPPVPSRRAQRARPRLICIAPPPSGPAAAQLLGPAGAPPPQGGGGSPAARSAHPPPALIGEKSPGPWVRDAAWEGLRRSLLRPNPLSYDSLLYFFLLSCCFLRFIQFL